MATAHQSDLSLAANEAPILYPSDAREIIAYGLAALSRYSGLVVGLMQHDNQDDGGASIKMRGIAGLGT